jgi:putative endonuclease
MTSRQKAVGKWGETVAAAYLEERGYQVLERNAYTPYGELDIVAREHTPEGVIVVFVEVKTRTTTRFGYPEQAVDAHKQEHLLSSAQHYLQERPELEDAWQVDVIAVRRLTSARDPEIEHFRDVIS